MWSGKFSGRAAAVGTGLRLLARVSEVAGVAALAALFYIVPSATVCCGFGREIDRARLAARQVHQAEARCQGSLGRYVDLYDLHREKCGLAGASLTPIAEAYSIEVAATDRGYGVRLMPKSGLFSYYADETGTIRMSSREKPAGPASQPLPTVQ